MDKTMDTRKATRRMTQHVLALDAAGLAALAWFTAARNYVSETQRARHVLNALRDLRREKHPDAFDPLMAEIKDIRPTS